MPRLAQTGVLIVSMAIANSESAAAATHETLTTAAELLSLTAAEAAKKISVSVTGVVTLAEPNWGGEFIVQDSTGGVFVNNTSQPQPALGDLVQVTGVSDPGGYAPDIMSAHWKKLGTAPLPEAKPVSAEQLMSGAEDGRRIEVTGVVRSARRSLIVKSRFVVELASGGYRFRAFPALSTNLDPNSLVGATVRLRGTDTASFITPPRQILTAVMFVPHESDFVVERYPDTAISQEPFTPLGGIAQYRRNGSWESRIRVKGVVMYQRPGEDIFLHGKTGGLQVEYSDTNTYAPGESVEAIGFPGLAHFLPVLEAATLIRTKESGKRVFPRKISITELLTGFGHADLISLRGKLLDYSTGPVRTPDSPSNSLGESIDPATQKPVEITKNFKVPETNRSHCQFEVWSSGRPGTAYGAGGTLIEKPGDYFFDLKVDGKNSGRLPLHVLLAQ